VIEGDAEAAGDSPTKRRLKESGASSEEMRPANSSGSDSRTSDPSMVVKYMASRTSEQHSGIRLVNSNRFHACPPQAAEHFVAERAAEKGFAT